MNTVIFIIIATIINIAVMIILLLAGLFLLSNMVPQDASPVFVKAGFAITFLCSIGLTLFIYHRVIIFVSKRIDMDKYFHPVFKINRK